jgi:septal ring factor EnvC (AmiA/AmiB activator)
MAASKGEQAMNPQYEAHARLCKSIGDMAKENEDLKQHVTELENRLRALWDKLEGERKHYMEQIRRLEEAGESVNDAIMSVQDWNGTHVGDCLDAWNKAKEAKP